MGRLSESWTLPRVNDKTAPAQPLKIAMIKVREMFEARTPVAIHLVAVAMKVRLSAKTTTTLFVG
jgi:hypothetical protein